MDSKGTTATLERRSGSVCNRHLTDLPEEVLEYILCLPVLEHTDVASVAQTCRRLYSLCQNQVWKHKFIDRWPLLLKHYRCKESCNWQEEFRARYVTGLQVRRFVASCSKQFFTEDVPCFGLDDVDVLGCPVHFMEDELLSILNTESGQYLTWKYYAKKILYFLRQQTIMKNFKEFLQQSQNQQSVLEGAVFVDQYCNPLEDISIESIQSHIDGVLEKIKKVLWVKNSSHPSLSVEKDGAHLIMSLELQQQVLDCINCVLYEDLKFRGNETDYYNPLNSFIHQVLRRRTGIPISMSILYLEIARKLGVNLEPVSFPSHFLLRWCQGHAGSSSIYDYIYIDAFGRGDRLTAKECELLIGQQVTEEFYGTVCTQDVLQRMVGFLVNLGKRESCHQSYQPLRDSLDLYLVMNSDNINHLMLQARLYFHLGMRPEKVLDILQHIQAIDPSQHGIVGYLMQRTLERIEHIKHEVGPRVKLRSDEKNEDIRFAVGMIMRHKSYAYNCVIFGWDPTCKMSLEWIRNMGVHNLPHGPHQPFYNVLVEDGSSRYAAQENLEYSPAPLQITHPEVGRYFAEFVGTHYVANNELQTQYPEDLELLLETVQDVYSTLFRPVDEKEEE
ncbi:F-box only protein 21 isoform X2 [Protopterus annectens]|uniref:F-box only protein 21 isoform X2 n=1 Tax=Protopterus annectens TaxID=7888 RepID=UPI001CFBA281|nr:F-box only protein 21 isoform X2 [Protopterus annectens]